MPRRLDVDGNADEDGPIVLTRLRCILLPPDAIRTEIRGATWRSSTSGRWAT